MRSIHLLIKPASGMCNMRCQYCFYADETSKRETPNYGIMSRQTISAVLEHALEAADAECTIAFQGGEPNISGTGFFPVCRSGGEGEKPELRPAAFCHTDQWTGD